MDFKEWWKDYNSKFTATTQETRTDVARAAWEASQQETLRDKFAAVALNGMLSNSSSLYDFEGAAQDAFRYADAMLKERNK